jgi:5,10-methenyltetrahydrofolate synthetase
VNTQASQTKIEMRRRLRERRKDYVFSLSGRLEQEYLKLAKFANPLTALDLIDQCCAAHGQPTPTGSNRLGPRVGAPLSRLVIASFKPQHSEISPKYMEEALTTLGHEIVWPRIKGEHLGFFAGDDEPAFVPGPYDLLEPGPNATEKVPTVILVPLVGFDRQGNRLGQGGGFYDRLLESQGASCVAIGLAWDCQEVAQIPLEKHDLPLAGVITPTRFLLF